MKTKKAKYTVKTYSDKFKKKIDKAIKDYVLDYELRKDEKYYYFEVDTYFPSRSLTQDQGNYLVNRLTKYLRAAMKDNLKVDKRAIKGSEVYLSWKGREDDGFQSMSIEIDSLVREGKK